jgi:Mn2+/Fe2+ NRAMP family transporter
MGYITIFGNYKTFSKYLLWLAVVFATYIVAAFLARPNWGDVLRATVIPQFQPNLAFFLGAVGLLGTTITPLTFSSGRRVARSRRSAACSDWGASGWTLRRAWYGRTSRRSSSW